MKRRKVIAILTAAAMVLGTAACGDSGGSQEDKTGEKDTSEEKESSQETGSKEQSGEITLLMTNDWVDESTDLGTEFTKTIRQYEEEHPGTKITLQGASQQDIKESFQTAALAGGGVDVVIMDNSGHAIDLAAMGLLYPLSDLTSAEELVSQYQEGP
ncbi:MAG: extracellular solute-binding protein [Blautia marasmi]